MLKIALSENKYTFLISEKAHLHWQSITFGWYPDAVKQYSFEQRVTERMTLPRVLASNIVENY